MSRSIAALLSFFAAAVSVVSPATATTPQSSAFTYQGQLNANGALANGTFQFTFTLYDAASGGNVLGSPQPLALMVTNGQFTAPLDFGTVFSGQQTWLDIQVGTTAGNEQPLSARQPVNAAPVALYALDAPGRPLILHYSGVAPSQTSLNSIPLGSIGGVSYSLQCWFNTTTNKLIEELDSSGTSSYDVHEMPTVQNDAAAIGSPQFLNATNFFTAQLWTNSVATGGHQEQLHMPLTLDVHSSPEQVQQGHIYMRATTIGFNSATSNTCDIEGEIVSAR